MVNQKANQQRQVEKTVEEFCNHVNINFSHEEKLLIVKEIKIRFIAAVTDFYVLLKEQRDAINEKIDKADELLSDLNDI